MIKIININKPISSILLICILTINITSLANQNTNKIKKHSTAQGLSNSVITSITQDNYGFIWIATEDGLNRFDGYKFTMFKKLAGDSLSLSDNFVSDIYFDKNTNLIWASTNYGLNCYDPHYESFTKYNFIQGNNKSLSNNVITTIAPSRNGGLWIGTYGSGIDFFDVKTRQCKHIVPKPEYNSTLGLSRVLAIAEDTHGNLWVGSQGNGLYKYNIKTGNIVCFMPDSNKGSIPSDNINTIFEDRENNIWIGSNNGLSWYNRQNNSFVTFSNNIDKPNSLSSNIVKSIFQDHDGILWIGLQSGGINKIRATRDILQNPANACFESITESDDETGLSYNSVTTVFEDRDQNIWIGTYSGGINMISNTPDLFKNIKQNKNNPNSLSYRKVWGICDDTYGNIWIGTDGGGINVYNQSGKIIKVYRKQRQKKGSLSDDAILCAMRDNNNGLWFGTYSGGLNYYNKNTDSFIVYKNNPADTTSLPLNDVRVIYQDNNNNIWIGTNGGGAAVFMPSTGKFRIFNHNNLGIGNSVRCILHDNLGNYWFGTYGQGVYKTDANFDQVKNYIQQIGDNKSIASKTIYAIHQDKKGRIWFGTEGGGLSMFNNDKGTFNNFNESDGLANHIVRAIAEDKNGFLWVTTNNGLTRFDPDTKKCINFDEKDGLVSAEFTDGSILLSNGLLYMGNMNGLSWIDPQTNFNTKEPSVYITDFQLFNDKVNIQSAQYPQSPLQKSIIETKQLVLNHKQSVFTLGFIAFNYRSADKLQYAYKLEGSDKQWNYSGNLNSATYRNLPAGNYVFKVKASALSGIWGNSFTTINIIVKPPIWKTWWAYTIYYIILVVITLALIRYLKEQNKLKNNLLVEKVTRQHEQQLNQEKLNFFTNITHEFRTPLTLIQGPIEDLLREHDLAYRFKKKLLLIYRNSNRLNLLINKLLDFRKVETGLMELKVSHGNIVQTIKEICFPFNEIFVEKKILFTLEHQPDEIIGWYDADKIQIILNNLLSNAYKYTNSNSTVKVTVTQNNFNNVTGVNITVADTGVGIPPAHLPNIFNSYYRAGNQANVVGSGIGLALTKSLVEIHNGTITAQSTQGVGSVFIINLPLDKNIFKQHQICNQNVTQISKPLSQITLDTPEITTVDGYTDKDNYQQKIMLIIEDNNEIREYIKDSFTDGFTVYDADNGTLGLELAFKHIPDIIITDIMMPGVDGLEVCRQIKTNIKTCHIPVVMLTARNTLYQKQEGYQTGADSYVTKPFSTMLLKTRVNNLLQSRKMLTEHISRTILLQPDELHINLKDEQFISDAISIIEKNLDNENFTVDYLCTELGISHPVLYRKIKALTGFSIAEFIRSIRLKNAAQLLRTKQFSISEVAFKVGFNDLKHFRQCFKEQYKTLPSDYIKYETDEP